MTNRTAFTIASVGRDAIAGSVRILDDRDDVALLVLRRPYVPPVVTTMGTVVTGVNAGRHQVHTLLVPGTSGDGDGGTDSGGLRLRTSRMSGAPSAWNRLASRGIDSLVVNFPFQPAGDDERVIEIPNGEVKFKAEEKETTINLSALGFIAGTLQKSPGIRSIFMLANFEEDGERGSSAPGNDELIAGDEVESPEDPDGDIVTESTEKEEREGRKVVEFLDALALASGAEHTLAVLAGSRLGYVVLIGPRASEVRKSHCRAVTCVPTLLDLLGEAPAADLAGVSLLSGSGGKSEGNSGSWSLDGGPCEPPDWSSFLDEALAGRLGDAAHTVACKHLFALTDAGLREASAMTVVEELKILDQIVRSPKFSLRLAFMLNQARLVEESRARIQRILDEQPGTMDADLATLLPAWNLGSAEVCEILDRYPLKSLRSLVHLSIVGRAAIREDRVDQGIATLWSLLMRGGALPQERLALGRLCMARGGSGDAARAVLALRDMSGTNAGQRGSQPRPEVVLLRANALAATGSVDGAKRLLQAFLDVHPENSKVLALLSKLSSTS